MSTTSTRTAASALRPAPTPRWLRRTLRFIALVQCILGLGFLFTPEGMAAALGLPATPGWVHWMFGMMAARFLAVGWGMLLAARDPQRHRAWIAAMIGIQLVDWLVTLRYWLGGVVTLAQVNTATFLPVVFMLLLWRGWPRQGQTTSATSAATTA